MIKIKLTDNFNFYNEVKLNYANPDLDLWNRFVSINNKNVTKINIEKIKKIKGDTIKAKDIEKSNIRLETILGVNKRNTSKDDDNIVLQIINNNDELIIKTGNFVGVIFTQGISVEIDSRFGKYFLQRMLNFANNIFLGDIEQSGYKKSSNTNPFKFIISYLFIQSLEKAWVKGFPKSYITQSDRGLKLKGSVDINELIKKDIPYSGKISFKYRNQQNVNEIVNVLYKAVSKVKSSYPNVINSNIHNITQDLAIDRTLTFVNRALIQKAQKHKSLQNSLYADYKIALNYAELIIEDLNEIDETDTDLKTTGYLIDISKLYELYLEKLLKNNLPDFNVSGQTEIISYHQSAYIRKLIPDLVLTNKVTGDVAVFDAKYKTLRLNKEDYRKDIDRTDFFQIHTYMGYYGNNIKIGGLIYPTTGAESDDLLPVEKLFGNHSSNNCFTIDGINTGINNDGDMFMSYTSIIENERSFIERFKNKLEIAFA